MKPLHVLIAEDESLIRMGLKLILEEAGHTVYAAEDGQTALDLAESRTPDIAILDIRMPRMDGMETARRLYDRSPLPILFLTAYGERELVEKAARLPIQGYLVKPLREAELFAMIEVALGRFEEQARTARVAADANAALSEQRTIQRAKGLIMQREGVSELEAHQRLERQARSERRPLLEVAEEIAGPAPAADRTIPPTSSPR
ncbi:MAG: response regulator [Deltaproteobacteria bacterium]|nr:response regulator [Deltaproteobacteria bacterium]